MTVTADQQLQFGTLLIADPYFPSKVSGLLDTPDVRTADHIRVGRNGYVAGTDLLGGRTVTIELDIVAWDSASFGAAVGALKAAFLPGSAEAPLSFQMPGVAGGIVARVNARPRRLSLPIEDGYWQQAAQAVIELFATDPLIYSDTLSSITIALAAATSGLTFPLTFPATFGSGGTPSSASVVNAGTATTFPTFTINGPVQTPTIRNETLGRQLTINIALAAGEFLVVDTANRTVLLNGTADRYSLLTTAQWFGLAPGGNDLRFSALVSSASTATISWRSAWI